MQQYQFDKIFSTMEKEFGKIAKGQEQPHSMMLFPMESNVLKIHRKYPASNSRRLREAIALTLFDIQASYTGETFDLDAFRNEDNARLEHALLMAFDPFTNDEIMSIAVNDMKMDFADQAAIHDFYAEPIICILRIKSSVDTWEKNMGSNGYFDFLEGNLGTAVTGDNMEFSLFSPTEIL